MKKNILIFIIGLLIPSFLIAGELNTGDKAPNLIGLDAKNGERIILNRVMTVLQFKKDPNGNPIIGDNGKYISEFIDNIVVLSFFQRTCMPCIKEIPTFNRIARNFIFSNVKFLYVNIDPDITPTTAKRIIKKLRIRIPIMLPNQQEAIRQYGVKSLPKLFIIGKDKKIAHIFSGFEENLESDLTNIINRLL